MSPSARNITVFALVLIVGAGAFWAGRQQGEINALSAPVKSDALPPEIGRRAENERLVAPHAQLETNVPTQAQETADRVVANASYIDRLHTLAELQEKKLANITVPIFGRNGELQANFSELFNLTPAETGHLQQAVDQARQQIDRLPLGTTNVGRRADGAVVISVAPSQNGSAIRDDLMNAFAQTLGPERNEAFQAFSQSAQFTDTFNGFGMGERTVTVTHAPSPNPKGAAIIRVQVSIKNPTSGSSGMSVSVGRISLLPENLRWVAPLIPEDF